MKKPILLFLIFVSFPLNSLMVLEETQKFGGVFFESRCRTAKITVLSITKFQLYHSLHSQQVSSLAKFLAHTNSLP